MSTSVNISVSIVGGIIAQKSWAQEILGREFSEVDWSVWGDRANGKSIC